MDLHYKQEITVGALVLAAIALFILGALWLGGKSLGESENQATIQFSQVGTLKEGVPVLISGVDKGKVEQIRLVEPGKVLVLLGLDDDVVPQSDATARIFAISALGESAIDFYPGASSQRLPRTAIIMGSTDPALGDRLAGLGDRADSVLLGAQELVNKRTAEDLHATMVAMQRMLNTISERLPAPTEEATRTMVAFRQLSARLDTTLANPGLTRGLSNLDSVSANLSAMTVQLTRTTATLDTLLAAITRGEGTLGKLATDSGLYVDLRGTLQSMKALIDDIKRDPGKVTVQLKVF
jgi:phospholipid/cholesterol/gamma-HCH transport system substrate-binding protein